MNNSDRLRALELLGKYKAMFTDKAEHTVKAELARREKAKSIPDAIVRPKHDPSGR